MPRILICTCVLLLLMPAAATAGPRFGIEGGGGSVWVDYGTELQDDDFDAEARLDFNLAGTVHFDFNPRWGLTTGLRYSRLGNDVDSEVRTFTEPDGNGVWLKRTTRHEYLGVPVLVRLSFGADHGPFLFSGAEVAWLVSSAFAVGDVERGLDDPSERLNAAAVLGAGIAIGRSLELTVRYGHGLVEVGEHLEFPLISRKHKTRELALTIGIRQ